ncbi:MAG: tripartite tricarboxylate transporter substrate binding protein [Rhodocyclaceae bacterium]|jgi:tripartite-type tricarboxylate transporter receptor subunit TctC|nr:tripartite tricarboxylate transporter substrate binding protein [Rhodocyclaceae bacterium]MCE2981279.1 tripartite tricarboxylate transporter substrate binding protein [Betaproteobacteria bacterium]MCA3076554.1 tripartite tricarboxylate transporter substrate binding protein [Rhodocyclaceae bacterium]MCA3091447.1 tripartite tricarboxylate transporter substrate binding protein [Rhodocyclaceae bacterium]MCA3094256.1 tripartite tricarboxylate transporter substrate binding protein [Rhodocyclaceae 
MTPKKTTDRIQTAVTAALAAAALLGAAGATWAADAAYPTRPIRIIVPFAPGGGNDIAARFVAQMFQDSFGQQGLVDNRPGAGSTLGTAIAAQAVPDGHTILVTHNAMAINESLYAKLPYSVRDFAHVALIAETTNVLVVHPSMNVKNVKDLIAMLRAKKGAFNYASTGAGGTSHLAAEYFKQLTGTDMVHVPYKGTGPALSDLVGGSTQFMIAAAPGTLGFIKGGRLTALATTGVKRWAQLPDLPTLSEAGVPGYQFDTWYGAHAPAKTPRYIVNRLNAEINKSLQVPALRARLVDSGLDPSPLSPEAFTTFVRSETERMRKIIQASGAKAE